MFKFKAHWAGSIQSSKSWESCSSFFDTALQVALVVGCHLRGWHTLVAAQGPTVGEDPGFNITVDFSKVWVTLPPTNHGLAAPPILVSVAGNELESLVLPAFSVGVWFKPLAVLWQTGPASGLSLANHHGVRLCPLEPFSFAIPCGWVDHAWPWDLLWDWRWWAWHWLLLMVQT